MSKSTKRKMIARLPATPCHQKMRDDIIGVAEERGVSIVEIQRQAYALFLSTTAKNCSSEAQNVSELERAS